jgi:ATP-dependent DNA helicase RecG
MDTLDKVPLQSLGGVGPRTAERLAKLGIHSVQDILFHLPLRYQDRTRLTPIRDLRNGDQAVLEGEIIDADIRSGRRRSLLLVLQDGTDQITLRFFHFSTAQRQGLAIGNRIRCFGEVRQGPNSLEMVHPEYRPVAEDDGNFGMEETLTPIYPTTEGIHQIAWRNLTERALEVLAKSGWGMRDLLPPALLEQLALPGLADAIRTLHRPPPETPLQSLSSGEHPAFRRLAFEEMLAHQIGLRLSRKRRRGHLAPVIEGGGELRRRLCAALPFPLTAAQQRVIGEIAADLAQPHPMMRLTQGDVGSGKTLVAAAAALDAIEAGYQVALMAPTELLAEQHLRNFSQWFEPLGIATGWLASRSKGKERTATLERLREGEIPLIIGTHALFQAEVAFARLGLVIVDEQHRFGVHQRMALRDKGADISQVPHQLIMTATPIPRTLAMSAYADLDLSVIDELPPGRTPVTTVALPDSRRDEVIERVRAACQEGRQAYWVCTLIEESEALQAQAAEETCRQLQEGLAELRIGLVHGRLKSAEKEETMAAFKAGALDLLVATTVIEVGVDVPNASLMIIENPERLGLAQLHQLRGRVGRGAQASHCVLMYHPPLSRNGRERLTVMRESNDGFVIARKDLEIRGPGEVLGTRQTGEMQFRIADLMRDQALVPRLQGIADRLLEQHPDNAATLISRWIGDNHRYIDA